MGSAVSMSGDSKTAATLSFTAVVAGTTSDTAADVAPDVAVDSFNSPVDDAIAAVSAAAVLVDDSGEFAEMNQALAASGLLNCADDGNNNETPAGIPYMVPDHS